MPPAKPSVNFEKSEQQPAELFTAEDILRSEIIGFDLNNCTPIDAMNKINEWKKKVQLSVDCLLLQFYQKSFNKYFSSVIIIF